MVPRGRNKRLQKTPKTFFLHEYHVKELVGAHLKWLLSEFINLIAEGVKELEKRFALLGGAR